MCIYAHTLTHTYTHPCPAATGPQTVKHKFAHAGGGGCSSSAARVSLHGTRTQPSGQQGALCAYAPWQARFHRRQHASRTGLSVCLYVVCLHARARDWDFEDSYSPQLLGFLLVMGARRRASLAHHVTLVDRNAVCTGYAGADSKTSGRRRGRQGEI